MALPKKVQEQADLARQIHAEVYPQRKEDDEEKSDKEARDEPSSTPENSESASEGEAAGEVQAETPDADQGEKTASGEDWEQKYRVLQGKYNAEVPRLHRELNTLRGEMQDLRAAYLEIREQQQPPAEESPNEEPAAKLLSEEDIEDYGEDLINVIKRAAKEELLPELSRLREENQQLKAQLGDVSNVVIESARDKLLNTLDKEVPNWKDINVDENFLQWLEHRDAFSGQRRLDMLHQAFEANDAQRVVAFFEGFIKEHTALKTPQEAPSSGVQPKVDMDSLVAPGKPKSGEGQTSGSTQPDERVWTQADISAFYRDVRRGVYRGRESEKRAVEHQIIKAVNENRVR